MGPPPVTAVAPLARCAGTGGMGPPPVTAVAPLARCAGTGGMGPPPVRLLVTTAAALGEQKWSGPRVGPDHSCSPCGAVNVTVVVRRPRRPAR
ncbi:hypothetical protein CURTO8I2_220244 [Curtobacterium sp. 8I-2]|nr:hypothetical protein CURTO8I2_220244 [Curtobacterium sp. 8I-2]